MKKDIAIYGMGGLGREIACMLNIINEASEGKWNFVGFFDDGDPSKLKASSNGKYLGNIDTLNNWPTELNVALCFGAPHVIRAVHDKIVNPLVKFPNIIHPNFQIADEKTFVIGEGNIIARDCAVTCNITIGSFNLFNGDVTFGHDVTTGDYNVFMPRAQVSGEVTIGNENLLGTSCFIKQQITIKDNTTIGAMSAVLTKPKSGCTYIGNPAKIFKF